MHWPRAWIQRTEWIMGLCLDTGNFGTLFINVLAMFFYGFTAEVSYFVKAEH